ncbi:hypothetical protein C1I97_30645 [Streptomyces sp. NTH33]|nr:hypothetical protein C1I97_30645 [Streptomyces sp. NTH33]
MRRARLGRAGGAAGAGGHQGQEEGTAEQPSQTQVCAVGLTRLFENAAGTLGARRAPGGGRCFHCDGTGLARPLWEPATGQA